MIQNFNDYIIEKNGSSKAVNEIVLNIEKYIKYLKYELKIIKYDIFGMLFNINIDVKYSTIQQYKGDFNILDFFNEKYEINISIYTKTLDIIDYIYVYSILQHELTHLYQILNFKGDTSKSSFTKIPIINKFKSNEDIKNFINMLYLSLEHEINATVSMVYAFLSRHDNKDYLYMKNILNTYKPYNNILFLKDFDYKKFLDSFQDKNNLLYITNTINKEFKYKEIELNELEKYYKNWHKYFKNIYTKFINKVEKILKELEKLNERFTYHCYSSILLFDDYSYKNHIKDNYKELFEITFKEFYLKYKN